MTLVVGGMLNTNSQQISKYSDCSFGVVYLSISLNMCFGVGASKSRSKVCSNADPWLTITNSKIKLDSQYLYTCKILTENNQNIK